VILVRLKSTVKPDHSGYVVSAPQELSAPVRGSEILDPKWILSPLDHWSAYFTPDRAMRMNTSGEATVHCTVTAAGALINCWLEREEPAGWGFGDAALLISTRVQMQPQTQSGQSVDGRPIALTLKFDPKALTRKCQMVEKYERTCTYQ
jgi:periplasmic protein TonB